ncbi:MAG: hypothetical protein KF712_21410 [Akkermansiaceae bacterium]|nr:hypothetical protein [Akkermansiaceae bacterium]
MAVGAATATLAILGFAAWSLLFSSASKLAGRWMPLHESGVSTISRWEYDGSGGRSLVRSSPPQPWFERATVGEVSEVEFLKDGTVILSRDGGTTSGKYRVLGGDRIEFDFGSGGSSVIPVEIGGQRISVLGDGGRVIGSYTKLEK